MSFNAKALEKLANDDDDEDAMIELAREYERGKKVGKDNKKAFDWYLRAANRGVQSAEFRIGMAFFHGDLTTKDDQKALQFIERAADKDSGAAQYMAGLIYFNKGDKSKAKPLFEAAQGNGMSNSAHWLAQM
jgi:TPR repeat protein